jgi:hypothetical protein
MKPIKKIFQQHDAYCTKSAEARDMGKKKELQTIVKICILPRTTRMCTVVMVTVFRGRNPTNQR